jgi:hypothetical protein
MIWEKYKLDDTVSRATEDIRLWQAKKGIIEISRNTLAVPIMLDDEQKGYVFHGQGKLLIDAIAETKEGAVGKPVEKELIEPFLMLGDTEIIRKRLAETREDNFEKMGYESQQEFIDKAEDLFDRFFGETVHSYEDFDENHGLIFAFQNGTSKFDILVADGSKLVYKTTGLVFVSNEDKIVLKSPSEVVVSDNGKSVIIKKGKSIFIKR